MSQDPLFSFKMVTLENANSKAKPILEKAAKRIGKLPNIYGMMANSPKLLETYTQGDSAFRSESLFNSAEKEIVYLTISKENACHYCVAVHSTLADTMSKVPPAVTDAIRNGKEVPDEKYAVLNKFTCAMVVSRGQPSNQEVEQFLSAGYSELHILDIIHAIAIKTISNYSNHMFQTPVDKIFQPRVW